MYKLIKKNNKKKFESELIPDFQLLHVRFELF